MQIAFLLRHGNGLSKTDKWAKNNHLPPSLPPKEKEKRKNGKWVFFSLQNTAFLQNGQLLVNIIIIDPNHRKKRAYQGTIGREKSLHLKKKSERKKKEEKRMITGEERTCFALILTYKPETDKGEKDHLE